MSGTERAGPRIEVWREPEGEWQWRYLGVTEEEGEPLELEANEPEPELEGAIEAAKLAYPGVPIEVLHKHEHVPEAAADPQRPIWTAMTAGLALALAAVALRHRRWWTALAAPLIAAGVVAGLRRRLP